MFPQSLQAKSAHRSLGKGQSALTVQQVGSYLGELGLYKSRGWQGLTKGAKRFN